MTQLRATDRQTLFAKCSVGEITVGSSRDVERDKRIYVIVPAVVFYIDIERVRVAQM